MGVAELSLENRPICPREGTMTTGLSVMPFSVKHMALNEPELALTHLALSPAAIIPRSTWKRVDTVAMRRDARINI